MKTRSNMAKILDNIHFFRNYRKAAHQYEMTSNMSHHMIDINI